MRQLLWYDVSTFKGWCACLCRVAGNIYVVLYCYCKAAEGTCVLASLGQFVDLGSFFQNLKTPRPLMLYNENLAHNTVVSL